jgi:5-methylcytosine-specific restriction endonuclease McrA
VISVSASVLVLNATYEPISYTRIGRAVALVLRGDAVIEEALPGKRLRHKYGEMPWPKTLRLTRYVRLTMDYRPAQWSKVGVLKRDAYTCAYCGKTATTIDHVMPQSRGGERRCWLNTVASCVKCNNRKRDRTPSEARMALLFTPTQPMSTHIKLTVGRPKKRG